MKLLFDFFPIVIFFIAFKFTGIYVATAAFLLASTLQVASYWFYVRKFEQMHLITFVVGLIFGGATLLLHNEIFIKWKPTVIYWCLALAFLLSQFFGKKLLVRHMLEKSIHLTSTLWARLNLSWVIFFSVMGLANLYVVYNFDTNTWVNFKLFGLLGLTFIFVVFQALFLGRYVTSAGEEQ